MWHVAGGGCLYKFILNWTFYLEVDLFSAWGQADMVTRSNHSWVVFQFKEFAADSSEFKCAWD
jgi:hypothetical protein